MFNGNISHDFYLEISSMMLTSVFDDYELGDESIAYWAFYNKRFPDRTRLYMIPINAITCPETALVPLSFINCRQVMTINRVIHDILEGNILIEFGNCLDLDLPDIHSYVVVLCRSISSDGCDIKVVLVGQSIKAKHCPGLLDAISEEIEMEYFPKFEKIFNF